MRIILIFFTLIYFFMPLVSFADEAIYDSFIKSRQVVATLYFQANSDTLAKVDRAMVEKTVAQLRDLQNGGRMIRVEGFSSPEGDAEENFRLSFFRARTVADIISAKGLQAEVALTGYGDLRAGLSDPTKERRVEIASYVKPPELKKLKVADKKEKLDSPVSSTAKKLTQISAPLEPVIDALAIEQAIMEKIGSPQTLPSASVSQVDADY